MGAVNESLNFVFCLQWFVEYWLDLCHEHEDMEMKPRVAMYTGLLYMSPSQQVQQRLIVSEKNFFMHPGQT